MQELHDDFGIYPHGNTRFNSTIIDDDHIEDCHMEDDDDGVEISQTHSVSILNEKCLLDELLQTEEVKNFLHYFLRYLIFNFSLNVKLFLFINNYVHFVWN